MNEQVIRILQDALESVGPIPRALNQALELQAQEIIDGDDAAWQEINDAIDAMHQFSHNVRMGLIEASVAAYVVLKDSTEDYAHTLSVSSRFSRRVSQRVKNGLQFDLLAEAGNRVRVTGLKRGAPFDLTIDGLSVVSRMKGGRAITLIAFSSQEDAYREEEKFGTDTDFVSRWQ